MRRWRVGNISMAAVLILAGVLLLVSNFTDLNFGQAMAIGWPIVMILLGIEMLLYLYFSKAEKPRIQFDGLSIFFVCIVLVGSLIVYGITSVFQSDVTKVWMEERMDRYQYSTTVSDDVDVANIATLTMDDPCGEIKVIPSDQFQVTRVVTIRYNDEDARDQLLTLYRDSVKQITTSDGLTITGGPDNLTYRVTGARLYVQYLIEKPADTRLNLLEYHHLSQTGERMENIFVAQYDGNTVIYEPFLSSSEPAADVGDGEPTSTAPSESFDTFSPPTE